MIRKIFKMMRKTHTYNIWQINVVQTSFDYLQIFCLKIDIWELIANVAFHHFNASMTDDIIIEIGQEMRSCRMKNFMNMFVSFFIISCNSFAFQPYLVLYKKEPQIDNISSVTTSKSDQRNNNIKVCYRSNCTIYLY